MATPRTAKVQAEIDKARAKLTEQQARLKELEGKRTELENLEIIDIVRGLNIPLDNLADTLNALKGGATSGQVGPKSATVNNDDNDEGDESE